MGSPTQRLDALTGLRFPAALAVAANHLWMQTGQHKEYPIGTEYLHAVGLAAIPFFFVLSGFVMAYCYRDRFPDLGLSRVRRFYVARAIRVAPVHLLVFALVVLFPYAPLSIPSDPAWRNAWRFVANLFLVHTWIPDPRGQILFNGVAWTLAAEIFFYFWVPSLLRLFGRWRPGPGTTFAAVAGLCVLQVAAVLAASRRETAQAAWFCTTSPYIHMPEFLIGVLLGLQFGHRPPEAPRRGLGTLAELAVLAVVVGFVAAHELAPRLLRYTGYFTPLAALTVAVFARQPGSISAWFSGRLAVLLGEVSYPFYMLHCLLFFHLYRLTGTPTGLGETALLGGGFLLVATLASLAVYWGYETPVRALLSGKGWFPGRGLRRGPVPFRQPPVPS